MYHFPLNLFSRPFCAPSLCTWGTLTLRPPLPLQLKPFHIGRCEVSHRINFSLCIIDVVLFLELKEGILICFGTTQIFNLSQNGSLSLIQSM